MFSFSFLYSVSERQVILKAGHLSYFSYLIISGSVFVNVEDEDHATGNKCYRTTKILHEGALFGVSSHVAAVNHITHVHVALPVWRCVCVCV